MLNWIIWVLVIFSKGLNNVQRVALTRIIKNIISLLWISPPGEFCVVTECVAGVEDQFSFIITEYLFRVPSWASEITSLMVFFALDRLWTTFRPKQPIQFQYLSLSVTDTHTLSVTVYFIWWLRCRLSFSLAVAVE